MSIHNAFFRVEKPFRIYRQFGRSESNTWIGRSRVTSNVYHALNVQPGDELHALVGGLFVADRRDGQPDAAPALLKPPKPPLEKNYGSLTDDEVLRRLAKQGMVGEMPRSEARVVDYPAARAAAQVDLPERHPEVVELMPSPEMMAFRETVAAFALGLDEFGATMGWRDHGERPTVHLTAKIEDIGHIAIERAFIPGYHVLDIPEAIAPDWPAGAEDYVWAGRTLKKLPKQIDLAEVLDGVLRNLADRLLPEDEPAAGPRP